MDMVFDPPYFAVIFASRRSASDDAGYAAMAARMEELAKTMPGYLGIDSARDASGFGLTVSYWRDEASIVNWRQNAEHLAAQQQGRREWYERFDLHVARVERSHSFTRQTSSHKTSSRKTSSRKTSSR
jgi:heme-degrading monooxygenase HmoA